MDRYSIIVRMLKRRLLAQTAVALAEMPAEALLGQRQVAKSKDPVSELRGMRLGRAGPMTGSA